MKVCIAEKPSVAREIAQILGAKTKRDGYFEGNGYQVTYTFGHFCTLYTPDDYQPHWKRWDLNTLPMLPDKFEIKLIDNPGVKKQFGIIKKLLSKADSVINCGDAGQEGELIQRWVLKEAGYKGQIKRLWISSLTKEAIKSGFQNLKDASDYDNLYYAGSSRAIGDWLLGMNATRLYTLKYGAYKQVLSVGRVQTPTLAMIVRRFHEIDQFKPVKYWELKTNYRSATFSYEKGRFATQEEGEQIIKLVEGKPFVVESVVKKKGKEYAPKLFDLTSLQVFANQRFGYTAEETLKLVQKLYEKKLVTYPRVDTNYLPNDVYPKVKGILAKLSDYQEFVTPLLSKPIKKSSNVFNDKKITDHHAIIPTGVRTTGLPLYESNIYDIITRRFIAVFYPECLVSNTKVVGKVDNYQFKTTGKEIIDLGWRVLFPKAKKKKNEEDKNEEKILPNFTEGEQGEHTPSLMTKETKPPKNYTEASLLRAMETAGKQVEDDELSDLMKQNGIGRPSTRANIIETLFRRKYILRKRKNILPTETGIDLIGTINNKLLKSVELTGLWEKQLKDIEAGTYKAQQFINNMKKMVDELVVEVRMAKAKPRFQPPSRSTKARSSKGSTKKISSKKNTRKSGVILDQVCPKCSKGRLIKGKTAYGCSRWNDGCHFKMTFEFSGKKISDNQILRLIVKGSTVNLKGFVHGGNKIEALIRFDDDYNMVLEPKKGTVSTVAKSEVKKEKMPCPKCKKGHIIRGKSAYGCSQWSTGCDFRYTFAMLKDKLAGRSMSKELVYRIISS